MGGGDNGCDIWLLGVTSNKLVTFPGQNSIRLSGSCCSVWGMSLVRWFIIRERAWASMRNLLMFCHGTQNMDNSRICRCLLFREHGKQNFVQPFRLSRKLLRYTHAWTKLHNQVMSWTSGAVYMSVNMRWPLPEVNTTTVRDLIVLSVSSLPLSIMVHSCAFIGVELVHWTKICFSTCAKPVRSI